jgi:hypothetical protein
VPPSDINGLLEAAYLRLLTSLAVKDVSAENSRSAALEALTRALAQLEVQPDPEWLSGELDRLRAKHNQARPPNGGDPVE